MSDNRVGEVLAAKYRLEELLGTGGMGNVYRATNELVGRGVAIKLLKAEHASNRQVVDRFMREARAANLVRHPNVVDVLDIGQDEQGIPFIVQELLVGEDLGKYAARSGGKLALEEVVELLCPVIDAVAEAHTQGVVHRDLKPENVFLARTGNARTPKLLDFGISKVRSSDVRATEVGMMMGTPAYMPPEQVQGARDADPRSDVWALGVMLFELLSGRLPFDGNDAPALFVAIATTDAPALVEVKPLVSPTVSRIVARCLRRRPDDRYPSAAELARDLRLAMDGDDIEPTGKRSVPAPPMPDMPELTLDFERNVPGKRGGVPTRADGSGGKANPLLPTAATMPAVPALDLPAPKGPPPKPAPSAPASRPQLETQQPQPVSRAPQPPSSGRYAPASNPAGRLAISGALPGVVMAPGSVASRRSESIDYRSKTEPKADVRVVYGIIVVGIVLIAVMGVLMAVAHRPEGWPVAQFLIKADGVSAVIIHGLIALVAIVLGGAQAKRGFSHWRGELGGGPANAVVCAIISGVSFFAAVELISAVSN